FHAGIQREASHGLYVELLAAGGLTAAALTAVHRSGSRSGGRSAGTPQAAAAYPGSGYRRPTSPARSPRVISNIGAASSSANLRWPNTSMATAPYRDRKSVV